MKETEVSESGIFAAGILTLVATVGHVLTTDRTPPSIQIIWLGVFILALATFSAAAVNFDLRRLLK